MLLWKEVMEFIVNTCQFTMGALMQVTALLALPLQQTWNSLRLSPLKVIF
uniref:AP-2 complex subunit beta-1 n=1 Tax=Pan troglodytes TaxID=9598 RepID=G2HI13_PANTR|nr:AP-2 complex subunit beta-1 [Pan troglodytes]